jgi:hypothetical protein
MRKLLVGLLITGTLCLTCTPRIAVAGSGDVAAGIVGGLAVGTLFGAAVASGPRYYYQPAPVYVEPAPVYVAPTCYWTRGAPVWDGYGVFGIGPASKFAIELQTLRVKSPASAGLFFLVPFKR